MNPADLGRWAAAAPPGTMVPASAIAEALAELEAPAVDPAPSAPPAVEDWRIRLWTVPSETRLTTAQVAEALGRPRSFVYSRTGPSCPAEDRIPHRKSDGAVVVTAGELRTWIREHETEVVGGPMAPPVRAAS